jgi:hypothetical protein
LVIVVAAGLGLVTAVTCLADLPDGPVTVGQVMQGRIRVLNADCGGCHNNPRVDPSDPGWLSNPRLFFFQMGPFRTYPRNLTPDSETGLGNFSDRQIFNALRYGLDPDETPDAVITANVPGQGNYPAQPRYLGPPMPWPSFRHLPETDLWAIVAYIKHGIKAVPHVVPESQGPPDFWASTYAQDSAGPFPLPAYPAGNEEFKP